MVALRQQAHQGKYQAQVAGAAIAARATGQPLDTAPWGPHAGTADHHAVPQVFFCDPPAAAVALTADHAERAGHRIRVVDVDTGATVPGAGLYADRYTGRARMVVDESDGYLLRVTFVGPGVEELIHSATIAVAAQVPVARYGTPSPASRRSAKYGSGCSRHTAANAAEPTASENP